MLVGCLQLMDNIYLNYYTYNFLSKGRSGTPEAKFTYDIRVLEVFIVYYLGVVVSDVISKVE